MPHYPPCKDCATASWEWIWVLFAEDVSNTTARNDLQRSVTLPHSERDLCTNDSFNASFIQIQNTGRSCMWTSWHWHVYSWELTHISSALRIRPTFVNTDLDSHRPRHPSSYRICQSLQSELFLWRRDHLRSLVFCIKHNRAHSMSAILSRSISAQSWRLSQLHKLTHDTWSAWQGWIYAQRFQQTSYTPTWISDSIQTLRRSMKYNV